MYPLCAATVAHSACALPSLRAASDATQSQDNARALWATVAAQSGYIAPQ